MILVDQQAIGVGVAEGGLVSAAIDVALGAEVVHPQLGMLIEIDSVGKFRAAVVPQHFGMMAEEPGGPLAVAEGGLEVLAVAVDGVFDEVEDRDIAIEAIVDEFRDAQHPPHGQIALEIIAVAVVQGGRLLPHFVQAVASAVAKQVPLRSLRGECRRPDRTRVDPHSGLSQVRSYSRA